MNYAENNSAREPLRTSRKSYGVKDWTKSPAYLNAVFFNDQSKKQNLACFYGKTIDNGGKEVVEIKPVLVRDAVTGRAIKGTNQILAQTILNQMKKDDKEAARAQAAATVGILTFDECTRHGLYLKKGEPYMTLTTVKISDTKEKVYNAYRYFSVSALQEQSIPRLQAVQYTNSLDSKISYLRNRIENEATPEGKSLYEKYLSYAHFDKAMGTAMFDTRLNTPELKSYSVSEYIDKLPSKEQNSFRAEIMLMKTDKNGRQLDLTTPEGLVANFNQKYFMDKAQKELDYIDSQRAKKEALTFDATNTQTSTAYLSKWLAASELASSNPNVTFLTDKKSIESVSKSISSNLDKAFSENNHSEVFVIGNQASSLMKQELREFRHKEQSQSNGRAASRTVAEQPIEQGFERF